MIHDWHALVFLALILTGLFAMLIVGGLARSRRQQARNLSEIDAAFARAQFEHVPAPSQAVLYGVWQTGMSDVVLSVRDGRDADAGTISRRAGGTTIATGNRSYRVAVLPGTHERADLLATDNDATASFVPACRFESRGWFGNQVGRYELADGSVFTVHARWNWPWRHAALPICRDGRVVGEFTALGTIVVRGLAVILPASIPLPVGLFMLCKGAGTRAHAGGH